MKIPPVVCEQSALAATDSTFLYIDTMDLQSQRYDGLHYSKGAKLELGVRMAKAWLDREKSIQRTD
jgi:hypothetical protein